MDEDMVVLPHKSLFTPPLLQLVELLSLIPANVPPVFQLIHDSVEVGAVPVNVYPVSGGGPVVHGGEKIREGGELLEKGLPVSFPNCLQDKTGERCTVTELLNQYTVKVGIAAEGASDVMGITAEADIAQMMKIVELPLHVVNGCLQRAVRDAVEKLSDNACLAASIFIKTNVVECLDHVHPKIGGYIAGPELWAELRQDIILQIPVEWIFEGEMSKVFHDASVIFGQSNPVFLSPAGVSRAY